MKNSVRISACVLAALTLSGCQGILSAFNFSGQKQYRAETAAQVFGQDELGRGRAALKAGYPAEAIKQFRLAALNEDAAPDAYNGLGIAYARLGRADLAERYFKLAVTLDSSNPRFAANLDNFYNSALGTSARALAMRQKEIDEALAAAALAAQVEGLLASPAAPERRGVVAIERAPAQLTRTSPLELRIATRGEDDRDLSAALPVMAARNPAATAPADDPVKQGVTAPSRINMPQGVETQKGYPIRITLTKPTASGKSRPAPARSTYPLRIALSPAE